VSDAVSPEAPSGDRPAGWLWLGRIAVFSGVFLIALVALIQVSALLGASQPETAEVGQLLNVWNVLTMVAAALLASWVAQVRLSRLRFVDLGLPGGVPAIQQLATGGLVGVGVLGAVVLMLVAFGWLTWEADGTQGSAVLAATRLVGILLGAAFVEELLFRGYPFQVLERRFGTIAALLVTSVAFSVAHLLNPDAALLPLINIGLAGLLLGVAYVKTRSLWFATGVHTGWNWVMAVSELSVSGLDFGMPGFAPVLNGPDLATGGTFGPEGGLLVTLASVATIVWMWRWETKDESLSRRTT
jgi:membrane protease YdiL (CAAX protease family)